MAEGERKVEGKKKEEGKGKGETKSWVGVCIDALDERDEVFARSVASLLSQSNPPEKVVLFSKKFPKLPEPFLKRTVVIEPEGTLGRMRNRAVELFEADFYVFISPDVVLTPFAVEKLLCRGGHILWGRQVFQGDDEGERMFFKARFGKKEISVCSLRELVLLSPRSLATASFWAVSREVALAVKRKASKVFPESVDIGEDGLFLSKALCLGFCARYVPESIAIHFQKSSFAYVVARARKEAKFLCQVKRSGEVREYLGDDFERVLLALRATLVVGSARALLRVRRPKALISRLTGLVFSGCNPLI